MKKDSERLGARLNSSERRFTLKMPWKNVLENIWITFCSKIELNVDNFSELKNSFKKYGYHELISLFSCKYWANGIYTTCGGWVVSVLAWQSPKTAILGLPSFVSRTEQENVHGKCFLNENSHALSPYGGLVWICHACILLKLKYSP